MPSFLKYIAVACGGILLGLLLSEAGLRMFHPLPYRQTGDRIVLPKNMRYAITGMVANGIDPVVIHTKNALGFRGPMPPPEWTKHLTIVAIGGSTTECFYLADGHDWPALLGDTLRENFSGVWVENAGLDGHSTYGNLVLLRQEIVSLRPNVALFLVGANDVGLDRIRPDDERLLPQLSFRGVAAFARSLAGYSEVAALALNQYRHLHTVQLNVPSEAAAFRPILVTTPESEIDAGIARHQVYRDQFRLRLQDMILESRAAGILPILITHPLLLGPAFDQRSGIDLARVQLKIWGETMDGAAQWQLLESYNDVTRAVGDELGVAVIDLAREMPKSTRYYYDNVHFNNDGASAVAEIIAANLCSLLAGQFPGYTTSACQRR